MSTSDSGDYEIERGIPFPGKQRTATGRRPTYPFARLEVGESFFVPSRAASFSKESKLCAALHKARQIMGHNFAWSPENGGYRIYRLAGEAIVKRHKSRDDNGRAS